MDKTQVYNPSIELHYEDPGCKKRVLESQGTLDLPGDPGSPGLALKIVKVETTHAPGNSTCQKNKTGVKIKAHSNTKTITEDIVEPINRWWEQLDSDFDINKIVSYEKESTHWEYLEHNGMIFTPEYVPHKVPIIYKGKEIVLEPCLEEIATYWAQSMGTNYESSDIYRKNFWEAFTKRLEPHHVLLTSKAKLDDVDFSKIKQHLEAEKQYKKDNKQHFQQLKQEQAQVEYPFSYALVDWIREKVSSNRLEPPGLFKGRGLHPKQGMLKARIMPEEVTLNLSKDAPVPKITLCNRNGHSWGNVYHDNSVTWLAFYRDSINDQYKYMYLAAQSKFKGLHDFLKYNKARELKQYIEKIRIDYRQKMASDDVFLRQLGTATYLIDFLALRVGGEKDQDEADTVGCCSLRVEHIKFENKSDYVTLDFLGKDSIRYFSTVKIDTIACNNLKSFCKGKRPQTDIFDLITTTKLNDYLKELMPGLSAKIFRTYNASYTLDKQLRCLRYTKAMEPGVVLKPQEMPEDEKPRLVNVANVNEIVSFYNEANRKVAILCNHQRSVPKQHESSMSRMQNQKQLIQEEIAELEAYAKHLSQNSKSDFTFTSKTHDAKGNLRKAATRPGMKMEQCQTKLTRAKAKLKDHCLKMKMKDDNKTVALGTSKINYMDPRITVAFCKRFEVPIEKIFNKTLRSKFPWAMYASSNFIF
ncbi:bifunctional DNA topoisomerase I [Babesia duncani]|uniref:DNA topoisomerase 1 n=1 Tax=Babesia duncani TaxID=323732 RepID=A0AAD9PJ33_9APIC|nr:bifunctional DNA topoisomerase I [Babesia duncani]